MSLYGANTDFGDAVLSDDEGPAPYTSTPGVDAQPWATDWSSPYNNTQVYPTPSGAPPTAQAWTSGPAVAPEPPPPNVQGSTSSPPLVAVSQSQQGGGFLTGLTSGITSFFSPARPTNPYAVQQQQQTGLPAWVLPVVIGVGGLAVLAIVMSSGRRSSVGRYRSKRRSRR